MQTPSREMARDTHARSCHPHAHARSQVGAHRRHLAVDMHRKIGGRKGEADAEMGAQGGQRGGGAQATHGCAGVSPVASGVSAAAAMRAKPPDATRRARPLRTWPQAAPSPSSEQSDCLHEAQLVSTQLIAHQAFSRMALGWERRRHPARCSGTCCTSNPANAGLQ